MENPKNKQWLTELKVLYLADYKKIKVFNTFMNPSWFTLVAVLSGSVTFIDSSSIVRLSAGNILAFPHGAKISNLSSTSKICLISCTLDFAINNRTTRFGSTCIKILTGQSPFALSLTDSEMRNMVVLFELLTKKISGRNAIFQEEMVILCLNLILYEFCGLYYKYVQSTGEVYSSNDKIVTNFITLVHLHCKDHHEIKFYADSLFISQGHLRKTVRTVIGMSAKHFIEMAIISEAYVLLADDNLSITEIGEYLNFKDSSSFSHFFKRHTKLSPSQYRLNLKF